MKTTLLKSLQRRYSQHTDLALIKIRTIARCSDDRISQRLYTSRKAYGNLILQAILLGTKKLRVRGLCFSSKMCFHYSGRSNPAEEIRFVEVFFKSNPAEARFDFLPFY